MRGWKQTMLVLLVAVGATLSCVPVIAQEAGTQFIGILATGSGRTAPTAPHSSVLSRLSEPGQ
jgi:hypothetical protein